MSLLKKYAATTSTTRETAYATLLTAVPAAPVTVGADTKQRMVLTIKFGDDDTRDMWAFTDQTRGIPAMIPNGGVPCQVVLQESKPDETGKQYLNLAYLGVGV